MKIQDFPVLTIYLWTLIAMCTGELQKGYIFTCPKILKNGAANEMQLQRYGSLESGILKVTVFDANSKTEAENEFQIAEGDDYTILKMFIPQKSSYSGRISISGVFAGDNRTITGSENVQCQSGKEVIVLIQVDKPIYKPGQTVKFRILKVNEKLKPVTQGQVDIWVEDPAGTRLFQWKSVPFGSGIKQLEFPLSEEPVQGKWKISVSNNGEIDFITFNVKEYVLPKFDIDIITPPFVIKTAEKIPVKICAKYTYGKKVVGLVKVSIPQKNENTNGFNSQLNAVHEIDGCYDYLIDVNKAKKKYDKNLRPQIEITVNVIEKGTGVERNASKIIQLLKFPVILSFSKDKYYKPSLPYKERVKISRPDETPAEDELVEICVKTYDTNALDVESILVCRNFTSDSKGLIEFTILPRKKDKNMFIVAQAMRYVDKETDVLRTLVHPKATKTLVAFVSPSCSYIHLQPKQDTLACGTSRKFSLLYTAESKPHSSFHYQIMKQGKVIRSGSLNVSYSPEHDFANQFQDENKVIKFETKDMESSRQQDSRSSSKSNYCSEDRYPVRVGQATIDTDIDFYLSPLFNLLVYYVRDDLEVVADSRNFKVEKCFRNEVHFSFGDDFKQPGTKTAVKVKASPNSLCGLKIVDKSISLMDSSDELTTEKVFTRMEDLNTGKSSSNENECIYTMPGVHNMDGISYRPHLYRRRPMSSTSIDAFTNSGLLVISDLKRSLVQCYTKINYLHRTGIRRYGVSPRRKSAPVSLQSAQLRIPAISSADTEMERATTKSVVKVRNYFPETWLFEIEMTGPDGEYITKEKLPHTITEWIGSAVCINLEDGLGISNTASIKGFQAFFISFTLPYSVVRGESFWISVSIFNYVEKPLPITVTLEKNEGYVITSESIDGDICVQPGESKNLQIHLKATHLGLVNITVLAETAKSSDVCGNVTVADAIAKDGATNSLIVEAEGWPVENVESIFFCPKDEKDEIYAKRFNLSLPEDVVPDSARAFFDFTGNVMGKSLDNLENLVVLPTGCGEQNMVKFAPNIVVLDYLSQVGELTQEIKDRAIHNLNTGAQRQLSYRHEDGSFSAFGARDKEGSMFLTAFVLRYFSQASKYITVDNNILNSMQVWITSKQQADGCFPEVGKLFDSGMKGGLKKEQSQGTITAYVLSSLLISGFQTRSVIYSALSCLEKHSNDLSFYSTFLYAYAEALAGVKDVAKERIADARKRVNNTGGVEYYNDVKGSKSKNLETAAYAVLSVLKSGGSPSDVLLIVRYMTSNLTPTGGFVSTQDTCVGLEALAEFAKLIFGDPIAITITATGALEEKIAITQDNMMLVKRYRISELPSEVKIEAQGSGCALVQKTVRYNSRATPQTRRFHFDVVGKCVEIDCNSGIINVSVSYLPSGEKTGMSVVEVKMISGMIPMKESLEKLFQDSKLGLMRYDVEKNIVIFYFYEITNVAKQFTFEVAKHSAVEHTQPGTAKVYDYYAKENSASVNYSLENVQLKVARITT